MNTEMLAALMALGPDDPATPINGCHCDFCTRVKKHEDNWCSRCADVRMELPKWWENMDVCDKCERKMAREIAVPSDHEQWRPYEPQRSEE